MEKTIAGVAILALLGLAGCGAGNGGGYETASGTVFPHGDPEAGRKAFSSLGCTLCHRASGEQRMPQPVSTTAGPEIGVPQRDRSMGELITAIIHPEHVVPEAYRQTGEDGSPMADYTDRMTIRQLVDIVAYIRYLGE
jgi:hypothetical protein